MSVVGQKGVAGTSKKAFQMSDSLAAEVDKCQDNSLFHC